MFKLLLWLSALSVSRALKCSAFASNNLPCVEIFPCGNHEAVHIEINKLSNGLGSSESHSTVSLCFDDERLYVNHTALDQKYLNNPGYKNCNDPIYNADVAEMFVAPYMETDPHCYNELDISPFDVMFDAGIYNPNLNHSGIQGSTFECETSGIQHLTKVDMPTNTWTAEMSFPFSLLNCPYNCSLPMYCGHNTPNNVYRINFYRINELVPTSKCTSSTCEYMAWNPTMANPPAFHEPTKFGFMLLQM